MSEIEERLAVFGGAFDPFHNGHVAAIRLLLDVPGISKVIVVPSGQRPDKQEGSHAAQRLEMTRLGIQAVFGNNPRVVVSDVQSTGAVGFATIDLLTYLQSTCSAQIEIVIGHELLKGLEGWHRAEDLKRMAYFLIITRPGEAVSSTPPGWQVTFLPPFGAQGVDISSTELRARLALGDPCQGLLPDVVSVYCRNRELYRKAQTNMTTVAQITPIELKARLDRGDTIFLLDVREPSERDICNIGGELIPKGTVSQNLDRLPRDTEIVVYCRSGGRSQAVAQELKMQHGFQNVSNLSGGMLRWSDDVDPKMSKY